MKLKYFILPILILSCTAGFGNDCQKAKALMQTGAYEAALIELESCCQESPCHAATTSGFAISN